MPNPACSEGEFIATWRKLGSPTLVAKELGVSLRSVQGRRQRLESVGVDLPTWNDISDRRVAKAEGRIDLSLANGTVIVFSDAHFWPGIRTTAFRSLLAMVKQMKPAAVICNGDAFDGASISRFPVMQWMERDRKPSVVDELSACIERLSEVEDVADGDLVWNLGNHDSRYEARLAAQVQDYGGIRGFHLKDHFPSWRPAWVTWINDEVFITHRHRGGIHATHTNVQANHCTTVTGHLHSLKVTPYTDGRGITKYGVDTGTLADPIGPQFVDYMEGRIPNWRSGFVLLTFKNGRLLMPELIQVADENSVEFRGHLLDADTLAVL